MLWCKCGQLRAASKRPWNAAFLIATTSGRTACPHRKWVHRQHSAERPRRRSQPEDQSQRHMPAFRSLIRNARRRSGNAVALQGRVHREPDDHAEDRRDGPGSGHPDDERAPLRRMFTERREVQPVRDRAKIRLDPRGGRRVLHDFARRLRDVELFAVRPRVLPQRSEIAERALNRPLVDVLNRLDLRRARGLSGPCGSNAPHHLGRDVTLALSSVGIDERLAAAGAKAIDRTAVKRIEAQLDRRRLRAQHGGRLRR